MDSAMDAFLGWFSQLPMLLKGGFIFLFGALMASQVNRATYRLAWNRRPIGPWSPPDPRAPARSVWDFVPIVGWLGLRRESTVHTPGFWIRPLLVELLVPCGLLALYWWIMRGLDSVPLAEVVATHKRFIVHALSMCLMLCATLIDFDEKTIPDEITIAGVFLALAFAGWWPEARLPGWEGPLHLASPEIWPESWNGAQGLVWACLALWFWCGAMLTPRRLWWKGGLRKALRYLVASTLRYPFWTWVLTTGVLGSCWIVWNWYRGGPAWESLLSSLGGLAFGTIAVWSVRLVASRALRKEALGFGDVTLMAMIGAFLGWQPTLMTFFLAPFAGMVIAVGQWLLTRNPEIAYGPYLCLAATTVIIGWGSFWDRWGRFFSLGMVLPAILLVCLGLMAIMLWCWRIVREQV